MALAGPAVAAPATARVVLVDADPELQHAVATALAPWKLELVVESEPIDADHASARADARSARFVVWRDGEDLVVYDRERGEAEHRTANSGALDPVSAAAAALTVKTLMRLPPPEGEVETPPAHPPGTPAVIDSGAEVRVQAGLETRFARGSETEVGARFVGAALVLPWSDRGWRFGLAGDFGTTASVQGAGFKGTWADWAVLGVASWTHATGRFEIEPFAAVGVMRSELSGTEMQDPRRERATLATLRGGAWMRWRAGMWSFGGVVGFSAVPGTPTYTRMNNGNTLFEVPSSAVIAGIVIAADLGR